jgi:hypothetical protein
VDEASLNGGLANDRFSCPELNSFTQFSQAALEKVISCIDNHQLFGLCHRSECLLQLHTRAKLIARSADKEFGLCAIIEEIVIIATLVNWGDGQPQPYQGLHTLVGASFAQTYRRPKRKSGENQWASKFGFKPIEGAANIAYLSIAFVVLAFTQTRASKIEPQYGKSEGLESLHGMEYHLVVKRPAVERMRVADESGVARIFYTGIEQSF